MMASEVYFQWDKLLGHLDDLQNAMQTENSEKIKTQLANFVDGYTPWIKKSKSPTTDNKVTKIH